MAEWNVIRLEADSNGIWKRASAEILAELVGGTVQMAYADLGITAISVHYWYVNIDVDTTQTDAPLLTWDGCPYGMIGWSKGGYYNPGSFSIVTLDQTAVYVANMGGGDGSCVGTWDYLEGDGFVAFKQTSKSTLGNNAVFVFDEVTNLVTGATSNGLVDGSKIISLDGNTPSNRPFGSTAVAMNDGAAYVEVLKAITYGNGTNTPFSCVYQAEHTYYAVWDYDSNDRDKNVLINGVKFNRMSGTYVYIPTE